MARKPYDEVSVCKVLGKKSSINIQTWNKTIQVKKNATDVGNGSWGKIDYLVKVHGYIYMFVNELNGRKSHKYNDENDVNNSNKKTIKREKKLNMAIMSKQAMKKVRTK